MDSKIPDPEMLKELDLLLNLDALDEESDWDNLSQMEEDDINKDISEDEIEEGEK